MMMPAFKGQPKKIDTFRKWLIQNGAEIMPCTNQYEVLRFRCSYGAGVLYQSFSSERYSVSHDFVNDAYQSYSSGKRWEGFEQRKRKNNNPRAKIILAERDGQFCFYCGLHFELEDLTQEHMLSKLHGGNGRLENKVLACKSCNAEASHLPIIEKVKMRDSKRFKDKRLAHAETDNVGALVYSSL